MSIKKQTISGVFWSLLQKVGSRGIVLLSTIILARILMPKDFGLVAMLMIFITLSQVLTIAGFNQALIQKKDADEEDYSTVFYINLAVSIIMYLVLYFSAPYISMFYKQPLLTNLTRVLSLIFVINAFSYVQEARLRKLMQFKKLAIIHLPSAIISGIVSIIMAKMGFGVWSLVALQVVQRIAYAVQIWFQSKWHPLLIFNKTKAKSLFSFGGNLLLSGIIRTIYNNIYLIIIGKFFPIANVGFYQNANNLVQQPTQTFTESLNSVTFPAFASIQDDDKKLKSGYKKIIQQLLFWIAPSFVFAGILAEPLFRFLFTAKWLPAVHYFQLICIAGIIYPLNVFNLNMLNVKGKSNIFLRLEIIKTIFFLIGTIVAIPFGITALLLFQAFNSIVVYFINSYYSGYYINYPMKEQLKDIMGVIFLTIGVGIIVFLTDKLIGNTKDVFRLIVGFGVGWLAYWGISNLLKLEPYIELLTLLKPKLRFRSQLIK